jgi:hypothetical protein
MGEEVVGNADRKLVWLELLSALEIALPDSSSQLQPGQVPDPKTYPFGERTELYIESMEAQFFPDLAVWWTEPVKERYAADERTFKAAAQRRNRAVGGEEADAEAVDPSAADPAAGVVDPAAADPAAVAAGATADPAAVDPAAAAPEAGAADPATGTEEGGDLAGPKEQGWVIELTGHHFHNGEAHTLDTGENYLRRTLIQQLREGEVALPVPSSDPTAPPQTITFTFKELGIGYPIISATSTIKRTFKIPNPNADPALGMEGSPYGAPMVPGAQGSGAGRRQGGAGRGGSRTGGRDAAGDAAAEEEPEPEPEFYEAPRYDFKVQFVWKETPLSKRIQARKEAAEAAAAAAAQNGETPVDGATAIDPAAEPVVPSVFDPTAPGSADVDPTATSPAAADPTATDPTVVDPAAAGPVTEVPPPDVTPPADTAAAGAVEPAAAATPDPAAAAPAPPNP